ncbi:diguanylate cyclase/phosphodiesterase [Novosphingobium sp. PhB165]|uniref:putative bifunctional diguanylate cyclase/phosphodiesterase n=1 Tax=Novosphingobium sp. PhB165 TaxID=2485105 RepID=UPI0010518E4B|nr:EAL domain-containing protein [Novosphingobium sp. PhB165]TCM20758.1 diguanylate cyclase/phosphodiesterase [Novosphingobium sp. PhB165]
MQKDGQLELPVAQYLRLRRHIPPLYGVLAINVVALAFTHRATAPLYLTLGVPFLLVLACLQRIHVWTRPVAPAAIAVTEAERLMRRTTWLGIGMALGFLAWALVLDQYGTPEQRGHVMLFIAATMMACIFCLTYLPRAATAIGVIVICAFTLYCVLQGSEERIAMALSIGVVTGLILFVIRDSFAAFVHLEASRDALIAGQRRAERLEAESARLARTDALTQLPNRRRFLEDVEQRLEGCSPDKRFSIGLLDLDGFKPVNDTHGHAQGDRLLQAIGGRIAALCDGKATVARLGGDEFGVIVPAAIDAAQELMQRICLTVQEPVELGDTLVSVGASGGVAAYPDSGRDVNDLFDRADFALYYAKRHARGNCLKFSAEFENLIRADHLVESALQSADLSREVSLVFQLIYDIEKMVPVAAEALARWSSPIAGTVAPEMLVSCAERLGILRVLTLHLFDLALASAAVMPQHLRISFNLSAGDLTNPQTITGILDRIGASGIDPYRLVFEVTETSLISNFATAVRELQHLRETGAKIALDDFGTGFSSFNSLQQLPLDVLKIDKSFADRIEDISCRRVLNGIRSLAFSMSLDCVIEGIETEEQLTAVRSLGFRFVQGFHLAAPRSLKDIAALVGVA